MASKSTGSTSNDAEGFDIAFDPEGAEGGTLPASGGARDSMREGASNLKGQAGDKLRAYADDGKSRATDALASLAGMIGDAAGQIDEKVGTQFGDYARSASTSVGGFADALRDKSVDDLIDDAKGFVQKSPAVAIGAAAAVGFVLARLLRSGADAHRDR